MVIAISILFITISLPLEAQGLKQGVNLERIKKDLPLFSWRLDSPHLKIEDVADILKRLGNMQSVIDSCLKDTSDELNSVNASLVSLGPRIKGEALDVTRERYSLQREKDKVERRNGQCKVLILKVRALRERFAEKRKELAAKNLFYRQPDIFWLITQASKGIPSWPETLNIYLAERAGTSNLKGRVGLLVGGIVLFFLLSIAISLFLIRLALVSRQKGVTGHTSATILSSLAIRLPMAAFLGISALFIWALEDWDLNKSYLIGLLFVFSFFIFLNSLMSILRTVASSRESYGFVGSKEAAAKVFRRLNAFSFFLALFILTQIPPLKNDLQSLYAQLIHASLIPMGAIAFLGAMAPCLKAWKSRAAHYFLISFLPLVLVFVVGAEWLGYRNLSWYFLSSTFFTYISGLTVYWIRGLLQNLLDDFATGRSPWSKHLRDRIGIKENEILKAFFWTKAILSTFLWGLWAISLFYFWSISSTYLNRIFSIFLYGFSVGKIQIVPARMIAAIFVFGATWAFTSWIKRRMGKKLIDAYMTKSARDALITLTGYLGFVIALIMGLEVAGFEFSNLAIIAGALSVGIGFGLQNIVNNFVSGLILLFERPIKRGDWIVVGQTEGYVKKVSVRSTLIQTFDRTDVIVPNSELISTQVTNWMLGDIYGRIKIPVGVAYGSDTRRVEKILLEVARAHPLVITNRPDMEPRVYFWEFGDSALNFRLDVFLKDIDRRRETRSEINFAIDEAFRKEGISIPFPQQDVYVKELRNGR
ncbi:MAG: mechanosensitive ion channel [Nitrospiraceae bacterium]|nr:mechanosensitive ion channel [Nitrospiraceae bacterium]